jgi:uncharacterized protein (TIGR02391 family)
VLPLHHAVVSSAPPRISAGSLEQICRALGDIATGSQITRLLAQAGIAEPAGESTKWKRIYGAVASHQSRAGDSRAVIGALHAFLEPGRFSDRPGEYDAARAAVNVNLALLGLHIGDDGRVRRVSSRARTLDEAQERADSLGSELRRRGVHPDVLDFCRRELLQENYFHAVLEACKSVADKVRSLSGLTGDGSPLFDQAFSLAKNMPPIAFNRLQDEWEISEHKGLATLVKGVNGTFRNPTGHAPAVKWATDRAEAMDLLTLVSMLHRRLDQATVTPSAPSHPHHPPMSL